MSSHSDSLTGSSEQSTYLALTTPLQLAILPYTKSKAAGVPGSERALGCFLSILRHWISVERWFCDAQSYADAVESLRKANKNDFPAVLGVCRSHEQLRVTSSIVIAIISTIGDGSRIDFQTTTAAAIGKRLSMVAGAESLPLTMPAISEIGSMGSSDTYSEVALRARKLLMQESMPSLELRRQKVLDAAMNLSASDDETKTTREVEELLADHIPMADVFFPLLISIASSREEVGLLELYMRNLYRPYTVKEVQRNRDERLVKFSFLNKPSESVINAATSVTSMTDLSRIVSSGSLSKLSEPSDNSSSESNLLTSQNKEKIPQSTVRTGVCVIVEKLEELADATRFEAILRTFPQFTDTSPRGESGPVNVLYFVVLGMVVGADENSNNDAAKRCETILEPYRSVLKAADVRRVSCVFNQEQNDDFEDFVPALFTFWFPEFQEDSLYRRIDPSHAMHLDLKRIAGNFSMRSLGSRHSSTCHVHFYEGSPRASAIEKDKKANKNPRIFVRALSFVLDFSSSSFERILVDALNALDLCSLKGRSGNHMFLNLVSDFEKVVLDPVVVEQIVVAILKRHGERVSNLGIVEVETRIVCCLSPESPPIAIRLFASNPTGYVHVMNTYVEAADDSGGERTFKLIGGTKASLASAGDSSWDGLNVNTPYPLTRPFDAQRNAALKASDTLYCYDLPALFEAAVEQQWLEASTKGGIEGGIRAAARPLMVMYTTELVVQMKGGSGSESWTMKDYLDGKLELAHLHRGAGANDVGMVAWLVALKTVEYPNGRQVILIANDITHKAGSFGTREDVVFKLASEYAREKRIPRFFIAANSGARIGLADKVKKAFKVAFKDPSRPDSGFDFLYLTKEDYLELTKSHKEVIAVPVSLDGREVYRITDIIGAEPDLGVENLKGSGLIAGETSLAYDDIFTMTIVLGR
jgi:acetyl-CoA carboxylase/biotin carboxylase 1